MDMTGDQKRWQEAEEEERWTLAVGGDRSEGGGSPRARPRGPAGPRFPELASL